MGRPKVLDCFAGGGAIPLEALRLGCDATAVDLNPVAHLIEKCVLEYPQRFGQLGEDGENPLAEDFVKWADWVRDLVEPKLEKVFSADEDGRRPCKLSFPAGILNFWSTCGVCDSWGLVRDGICHCEWSGGDGCLLGEVGDRGFVGAVCLAQG